MEPYIMPLHSSSPPPLDDDGDGEAGSEEDEFGDFGGFTVVVSRSPLGLADSPEPPSSLTQPSPATKPAHCSSDHPVKQSQPVSTVNSGSNTAQVDAEPPLHLTNGYAEGNHKSGARSASIVAASSPEEETGFADFTVFAEQAAHPWCCGFSPLGSAEQWAGGVEGANVGQQICDRGREVVTDSEPRPPNVCAKVEHCEKRDAALVQPSQGHRQPQEAAAAALGFPSEEDAGRHGDSWRERRLSLSSSQTSEVQEDGESEKDGVSTVPQTVSVYESASEDMASFCDDLSFEGASADLEPNVSSLASQEDQTDWDQTDAEDEELGNYRHSDSLVNSSAANLSQSEEEKGFPHCDRSATQETSATSNPPRSVTHTEEEFADFDDSGSEHHGGQERVQTADVRVQSLGSLPPSDSFADFCSAPTQEDGEGSWADFQDQRAQEEGKTWTQFRDQVSSLQTDGEDQDRVGQYGVLRRDSCQASLSCRVQQLLLASFPEVVVPAVEGEEEVLSLGALLHARHLTESEEEEKTPELSGAQWVQRGLWWPHQDAHSAVGLQFQWGGSHTNRTLLRCLRVDTRNIVFIGMKKQPVAVPAFASSLGMLEPTKDSVPAVCSPGHTAVTAQAPPGPQSKPDPSTDPQQGALPSSQLDWSSRGLSSSQDGTSPRRAPHFWGRK